jgi:hypothetical protein
LMGGAETMLDEWDRTLGQQFFDMSILARLASECEVIFRDFYMLRKGHATLALLKLDPAFERGVFQRLLGRPKGCTLQRLFQSELGVDLEAIPHFVKVKELFVHRHLYAHNGGVVDEKYLADLKAVTGVDLLADPRFAESGYPNQDVYWFEPLERVFEFHTAANKMVRALPYSAVPATSPVSP